MLRLGNLWIISTSKYPHSLLILTKDFGSGIFVYQMCVREEQRERKRDLREKETAILCVVVISENITIALHRYICYIGEYILFFVGGTNYRVIEIIRVSMEHWSWH